VGDEISFGGITFRRYRGGFGVPTDKVYFYPEGVDGLFEIYYAPAGTFETVNTVGLPLYARMIPAPDRDKWVRLEIESNPLPICTRPQVLRSARGRLYDRRRLACSRPRGHPLRGRRLRLRRRGHLVGDQPHQSARVQAANPPARRSDRDRRRGVSHLR